MKKNESILPGVSIIILNWNGWKDTLECLESLYQISYPNYDVIVLDNASSNESIEKIREYCEGKIKVKSDFFKYDQKNKPIKIFEYTKEEIESLKGIENEFSDLSPNKKLMLIKNDKNYGFAEGNNIGIRYALNSLDSDYILLLNNDTVIDKEFLNGLVEVAEDNEKAGFLGPKVYYYDFNGKKNIINFAGSKINMYIGRTPHTGVNEADEGQHDHIKETDYVEGSCMLAKSEMLKKIGLIDLSYFAYWEETDWCMRGLEAGYKSIYTPNAKIWHKVSLSSVSGVKIYYFTRNRFLFMKKHATKLQMASFLLYFFIFYFWFKIGSFLFYNRDIKLLNCFLKAVKDGINIKP